MQQTQGQREAGILKASFKFHCGDCWDILEYSFKYAKNPVVECLYGAKWNFKLERVD